MSLLKKTGFHAVYYVGAMPRFVRAKTWFVGIILCIMFLSTKGECPFQASVVKINAFKMS